VVLSSWGRSAGKHQPAFQGKKRRQKSTFIFLLFLWALL